MKATTQRKGIILAGGSDCFEDSGPTIAVIANEVRQSMDRHVAALLAMTGQEFLWR